MRSGLPQIQQVANRSALCPRNCRTSNKQINRGENGRKHLPPSEHRNSRVARWSHPPGLEKLTHTPTERALYSMPIPVSKGSPPVDGSPEAHSQQPEERFGWAEPDRGNQHAATG